MFWGRIIKDSSEYVYATLKDVTQKIKTTPKMERTPNEEDPKSDNQPKNGEDPSQKKITLDFKWTWTASHAKIPFILHLSQAFID